MSDQLPSEETALADAVSRVAFDANGEITSLESRRIADAILSMPEMQAIKQALRDYVAMRSPGTLTTADTVESVMERNLRWSGLPESITRWVMQP